MRRIKMLAAGVVIAVVASLLGMSIAPADDLRAVEQANDALVPVSAPTVAFGQVCTSTSVSKDVMFAIQRSQGGSNSFADGSAATLTVHAATPASITAAVLTANGAGTVTIPASWSSAGNGALTTDHATARVTFVSGSSTTSLNGSVTVQVAGTNASNGGSLTRSLTLNVTASVAPCDTTPPTLHLPSSQTVEATGPSGAPFSYSATATDTAPPSPAVGCAPASGSTFALGSTTVTCSSTDTAGNTATGSFTVTVVDTIAPAITGTSTGITAEATGSGGATISYTTPTATDAVDGARPVTCAPASPALVALGTTNVTCSASDTRGNTATSGFSVTVQDTTAPVLTLPSSLSAEATSPAGAAVAFTATAQDVVDGALAVTCTPSSGTTFPLGSTQVECAATDDAENTAGGSFSVAVVDTTDPELHLPGPQVVEATGPSGAAVTYEATATDLVDGDVDVSCSVASGSTLPLGTRTITCSASDAAGNLTTDSFQVTVADRTAPHLLIPTDVTAEGDTLGGSLVDFAASASDLVDGSVAASCDRAPGLYPVGTTLVECSAVDASGNHTTGSFSVTITDTTPPLVQVPDDIEREATGPDGAATEFATSADDVVEGPLTPDCDRPSGDTFPLGDTLVTCTATDGAGNTGTASFEVIVRDTTAPTITAIADVTAEAAGPQGAVVTYVAPVATDLVDGPVEVSCEPESGSTFPLGPNEVRCSASDAAGNTAVRTFTVTVFDTQGPVLVLPEPVSAEATGPDGAAVAFETSADDVVDGTVDVDCEPPSGSVFPLGSTDVTCTAADSRGNESSGSFTVTVLDTTAPVLVVPDDLTLEATGPDGAAVEFAVSADDLVDGAVTPLCDAESGQTFPLGTTVVTCTATDAADNPAEDSFRISVVDTTAPSLTSPGNQLTEATGPAGATVTFTVPATDAVSTGVTATCAPASGSTFPIGTTAVSCSATDGAGNTGTASFSVTVQDTTAPSVTVPADLILEATSADGAVGTFEASASDIVDGTVIATCDPATGSTFGLGTTTVTCSATDAAGNPGARSFTVTVRDTTAPEVGAIANLAFEATGPSGAVGTYTAPGATDDVSGALSTTCVPPSGSSFALGSTTVTCTATDGAGNTGTRKFNVVVADTTAPVLALPADMTVEATGPSGAAATFAARAVDLVDGEVPVSCEPASGSTFVLGTTSVACAAVDTHGNEETGGFTVTVRDTTAPVVSHSGDVTVEATGPTGATVGFSASASDAVDGVLAPGCSTSSGSTFPLGTTTVTCTATDAAGNTGSASFDVIVRDTTAPQLTVPADIRVRARSAAGAPVSYASSATDVVSGSVAPVCAPVSGSTFPIGTTPVSCTAEDGAANTTTAGFTVTVELDLTGGILQPVRPEVLNVVKGGSTVPLKWQVPDQSRGFISSTGVVSGFKTFQVLCSGADREAEETFTTTGGTQLRYDTTANQFIQNWQTPKAPGKCYRTEIHFVGGQKLIASFQLK